MYLCKITYNWNIETSKVWHHCLSAIVQPRAATQLLEKATLSQVGVVLDVWQTGGPGRGAYKPEQD